MWASDRVSRVHARGRVHAVVRGVALGSLNLH